MTRTAREAFTLLCEANVGRVQGWLDQIAEKSPEMALRCFVDLAEYAVPKLARTELTGENGSALVPTVVTHTVILGPEGTKEK